MSCRHDLANTTCKRCYPETGTVDPGSEDEYEPNLEGPGAVARERREDDGHFHPISPPRRSADDF